MAVAAGWTANEISIETNWGSRISSPSAAGHDTRFGAGRPRGQPTPPSGCGQPRSLAAAGGRPTWDGDAGRRGRATDRADVGRPAAGARVGAVRVPGPLPLAGARSGVDGPRPIRLGLAAAVGRVVEQPAVVAGVVVPLQ